MKIRNYLDRKFYSDFSINWDDQLFRSTIDNYLSSDKKLLDVGAGAGIVGAMNFKGIVEAACGIDPDPRVVENKFLDEGRIATGESIPYPDEYFDIVVSDNVLEHLENPNEVLLEILRVLKSGGVFLAKTPNKSHYMPLIARLTPTSFHQWFNRRRGRKEDDTFPTLYRINSTADVSKYASRLGFEIDRIELYEGRPEYLRFVWITYLFGLLYERLVNKFSILSRFRVLLIIALRKP